MAGSGSGTLRFAGLSTLGFEFFGKPVRIPGVLQCLFGQFVSGQMIPFAVCSGRSLMSVRREGCEVP